MRCDFRQALGLRPLHHSAGAIDPCFCRGRCSPAAAGAATSAWPCSFHPPHSYLDCLGCEHCASSHSLVCRRRIRWPPALRRCSHCRCADPCPRAWAFRASGRQAGVVRGCQADACSSPCLFWWMGGIVHSIPRIGLEVVCGARRFLLVRGASLQSAVAAKFGEIHIPSDVFQHCSGRASIHRSHGRVRSMTGATRCRRLVGFARGFARQLNAYACELGVLPGLWSCVGLRRLRWGYVLTMGMRPTP